MKICFILTQDLTSPSGLGRYLPWATELANLGHKVNIVTLHSNYKTLEKTVFSPNNNLFVNYVGQMHVKKEGNKKIYFSRFELLFYVILACIKLTNYSLETSSDLFVIGKPHPMNSIAGLLCKLISGKKIILDCDDDETNSGNFSSNWQKKIISIFERKIPKLVNLITVNTSYSYDRLVTEGINQNKLYLLSNGIDENRFVNIDPVKLECLKSKLGIEQNHKVIGYIGSISFVNHPIQILIESFRKLIDISKNFKLLIVGAGEDFNNLQTLINSIGIQDNTIITGRIPSDEIKYYYAMSSLTVDPVKDDIAARARSPLKIFESLFCKVPVVSMKLGDRIKLMEENAPVYLVETDEEEKLTDCFIRLFQNNESGFYKKFDKFSIEKYFWKNLVFDFNNYLEAFIND